MDSETALRWQALARTRARPRLPVAARGYVPDPKAAVSSLTNFARQDCGGAGVRKYDGQGVDKMLN